VGAAEEAGRGAILLAAPKTAATSNGLRLLAALRGLADTATVLVTVAVQLDHAPDLRVVVDAIAAGADSVLADGSSLPYEDNIALVLPARALLIPTWCLMGIE
jgi:tagatose 1,6-diphosphate aldolase GatY/KbaY